MRLCVLCALRVGLFILASMLLHLPGAALISTTFDPAGVASADFNHDGAPDLAYVDGSAGRTLHILLGRGDGTFSHGQDIPLPSGICGFGPCQINIADVTGDGNVDILLGSAGTNSAQIAVFVGNGDGTFQQALVSTLPLSPGAGESSIAHVFGIGDLNGDGAVDLVVPDLLNNDIHVLLGDNTGKFTLVQTIFDGGYPANAYLADLNGDGHLDAIVVEPLGGLTTVFLGRGDGTLQPGVRYNLGSGVQGVAPVDLDGDGHLDLLVSVYPGNILFLRGSGDGTFATPAVIAQMPATALLVGTGDYNKDGFLDILLLEAANVDVLPGKGNLTFGQMISSPSGGTGSVATLAQADFNKDGRIDIALGVSGGIALLMGNGDGSFSISGSTGLPVSGLLSIAPEPSNYGQAFTATLIVTGQDSGKPAPTGSVSFSFDGTFISTVPLSSGQASYVFSPASPGTHTVVATYNGDNLYAAVTFTAQHSVNPPVYATRTVLTTSTTTLLTSQTVRLTATVTSAGTPLLGTVTFLDGTATLNSQALDSNGIARFDTAMLPAGTHSLSAVYQGFTIHTLDLWEIFSPSTSDPVSVTVNNIPTTTTIQTLSTSATIGTVVTFSAAVSASGAVPFGGITFYDGTVPLGSMSVLADGSTRFSIASLNTGTHSITAAFNANGIFAGSKSNPITLSITPAAASTTPSFTILSTAAGNAGDPTTTLVATVGALTGSPRGLVVFLDNGAILGSTATDRAGIATITLPRLLGGTHSLRASFGGDIGFAPSVSPEFLEIGTTIDPGFSLQVEPSRVSLSDAGSAVIEVIVSPLASFAGQVNFSCGDGLPNGYSCFFAPSTLVGGGTSTLTVRADSATANYRSRITHLPYTAVLALCFLGAMRRRTGFFTLILVVCFGFVFLSGCGSQLRYNNNSQPAVITVRASSGSGPSQIVHSTQFAVVIRAEKLPSH